MRILLATVVASVFALAAPVQAVRLEVGYAEALPGDEVTIDVVLDSEGEEVAATQNDIWFEVDAPIAAAADLAPDCTANPEIGKEESVFAYLPTGCVAGGICRAVRALILSFSNVDPIPDGVLYTCRVALAAGAPAAPHFLHCANAGASTPDGTALFPSCRGGEVLLPGGTPRPTLPPTPTPIATLTRTPTPTPTRIPPPVGIEVAYVNAQPGETVVVDVVLRAPGVGVAGLQNDIEFPPEARILATDAGRPDCTVNPDINKPSTAFAFLPIGCMTALDCSGIRALVIGLDNVDPIPDGLLYSCRVAVAGGKPTSSLLSCRNAESSDANGNPLITECRDGAVLPPGVSVPPTRTARPTRTPIDDEVRTRKPTGTRRTTATALALGTPTASADGGGVIVETPTQASSDDDGCAIGGTPRAGVSLLLAFPALLLFARRR